MVRCCGRGPSGNHHKGQNNGTVRTDHTSEAASPLAPGDKYPQPHPLHPHHHLQQSQQQLSTNRAINSHPYYLHRLSENSPEDDNSSNNRVIMTGNGFFVASSPGLMKSKSGSLPDRYNNSPRGFRDTFVSSMTPPVASANSATSSPHHHHQIQTMSNGSRNDTSSPKDSTKEGKKWTFGGLFKRKVKTANGPRGMTQSPSPRVASASPISGGSMSLSSPSPAPSSTVPTGNVFSPHPQPGLTAGSAIAKSTSSKYVNTNRPVAKKQNGKISESDLSSEDSEQEGQTWAQSAAPPTSFKQNFLTRRLSRRKEKAAAKKKSDDVANASQNGFLRVPGPRSGQLNNGKRVGSSPDSLNNTNGSNMFGFGANGPWPSWEITKKVPQLQAANNYSSSGSLSQSLEGSSKGSRMAAKEAVKARAVARRESFFRDTSSEGEDEDVSRSSIQGSHSSLSSRNRRRPYVNGNGNVAPNYANPPPQQGQTFRPADFTRGSPSSPAKFDYQNNYHQQQPQQSPSYNRKPIAPGSPRWEARVVYQQENVENQTPFVVKLPKETRNLNPAINQGHSGYTMSPEPEHQQVITAGLRVPISAQAQPSQYITEEVTYANLPNNVNNNQNNMRTRSATPQQNYTGYNNVNPSPPPPPPRRDINRLSQQNPNFYRPVSCSYLDSYKGFFPQRNPSPNLNGNPVRSYTPVNQSTREYYESQSPQHFNGNNYNNDQDQVDNSSHLVNNNFLVPNQYPKHANLVRSPSEPPEIKVQYARDSPVKRNAITPSPAPYNYNSSEGNVNMNARNLSPQRQQQQPVITSKLGFPVRRLQEAHKIPGAQSPVHMRASEFWRKKEAEVTGNPVQPNPNQKRYINRIRSADSSPLPIHRMRNSPMIQNSNETISSLSDFSAEAASPHMFSNNLKPSSGHSGNKMTNLRNNPVNTLAQNPGSNSGQQNTCHNSNQNGDQNQRNQSTSNQGNNNNSGQNPGNNPGGDNSGNNPGRNPGDNPDRRERTPSSQSACERLKVRVPSAPSMSSSESSQQIRSLVDLNNGRTPGRNLEDALNELEDMYKSLRLSDEDLLDRAERRDLPTAHQELRNAPLIPLPQSMQHAEAFRFEALGSVESLATGSSSGSGTNYSGGSVDIPNRVRAPPLRRSARPDTVTDDMARRRIDSRETKPLDPRNVVSQTGSYMVLSPAFSPPVSPCPPETLPLSIAMGREEPDLTLDDVTFRNYRKANSIKIIDPQPPFGIPLGPITAAPGSDYLHSKKSDRLRPLFKAVKNPDLINDDIAFRNLRKDLNSDNNLSKDWTPRLFSPTRDTLFNYNNLSHDGSQIKKLRAIRSLSANVTNFIPFTDFSFNSTDIGKWNSFTDLHHRHNSGSPSSSSQKRRASTYLQPSWVDQIEKVQTSTETLTENRNSKYKFASTNTSALSEPEHWDRKLPSKTVQLTPELYDPSKPRRPWTDIILESFEKEKEIEEERIAAEAAAANANVNDASNNVPDTINDSSANLNNTNCQRGTSHPTTSLDITEEDDDVFVDAREEPKSTSPDTRSNGGTPPGITSAIRTVVTELPPDHFHLLTGQKNRRGSWVEPRTPSGYLSSDLIKSDDDRRRKSWSDFPKDGLSPSEFPSQSPIKKLFTPLPPPRKIKQINLEAFNPSTSQQSTTTGSTKLINEVNSFEGEPRTKNLQIPSPKSPNRGEEELNELMDMLIREADTCGPAKVTSKLQTQKPEEEEGKCSSSSERVKASISTGTRGKAMSLPKTHPDQKSPLLPDEPTTPSKKMEKTLRDVTLVPDIVSVTRKAGFKSPQGDPDDPIDTSPNPIQLPVIEKKQSATTTTISTATIRELKSTPVPGDCSIDELIDSINESLPELEAGSGSHKSTDSSLSTGSLPSVPSPVPGSPTTITFPDRNTQDPGELFAKELEKKCQEDDEGKMDFLGSADGDEGLRFGRTSEEKANEAERTEATPPTTSTKGSIVDSDDDDNMIMSSARKSSYSKSSSAKSSNKNDGPATRGSKTGHFTGESPDPTDPVKKSAEVEVRKTNERNVQDYRNIAECKKESSPGNVYKGTPPFLRASASRSRSQSLIGSVSTSPTAGSEFGEFKKEKDKSHKRKSHLNRAFTEELVPDSTNSLHLSPHVYNYNLEQKSTEVSSSDYNSTEPRSRCRTLSNAIYKVPPIPSILTTSNPSPVPTPPDNSISTQLPSSPKTKPKSSSILNKVQTFESRKSSPVVKHDSFSDAEGVSFIKKLLHKESMAEKASSEMKQVSSAAKLLPNKEPAGFMLKKSPSAGSNSYWSKFSNSQPAFLKKFFDKPEKAVGKAGVNEKDVNCRETEISTPLPGSQPEEEPVLGFSVAQKASFFMKLEHEQRFSRWRKNSLEGTTPISIPTKMTPEPVSRSSRQLTQPVTTMEVQLAAGTILGDENSVMEATGYPPNYETEIINFESDLEALDNETGADISSYTEYDESISQEPSSEPSKLSLKDRVHMFDKMIATGTKVSSAAPTPHPMSQYSQGTARTGGFPMYHSSSTIITSSSGLFDNSGDLYAGNQFNNSSSFLSSQKYDSNLNNDSGFIRRRGSASDLELSSTPKYSPAVTPRNSRTKSLFVADNDVSEDGEVSSGGQEVAEIISRSYENSPVVRKKSWRTQKQEQTSFTKEIWRRCKVNDNWSASQDSFKKPERNYRMSANVAQVKTIQPLTQADPPALSTSPPATSNLLQILTVLSSSNDELSESKPKPTPIIQRSVGNSSTGSSVSIPENSSALTFSSHNQVNVPHPDDESFQMFFGSSRTSAFSQSTSFASSSSKPDQSEGTVLPHVTEETESQSAGTEMNGCQRQSDLLVMKKNVPILRRKSSGKSKNPLKALAARMDFRNQWYTDASGTDPLPKVPKYEDEMF